MNSDKMETLHERIQALEEQLTHLVIGYVQCGCDSEYCYVCMDYRETRELLEENKQ